MNFKIVMNFKVVLFSFCCLFLISKSNSQESQQLNNSLIAFTLEEKDLLPESIAYDSVNEDFYMSSTRKGKIVKIASDDGSVSDFISEKQDGLWMTVGIKIDAIRRILWVCSSGGENLVGYNRQDDTDGRPAGIFKYNLNTGKLIKKYTLEENGGVHFFNDICIASNGDVYITHMFKSHGIYKISMESDALEKVYDSEIIKYPNGICLSDDDSKLYIAHSEGIAVVETKNGKISSLKIPEGLKIKYRESIDGLYFYNNTLIGVQPDIKTVQQFNLDSKGSTVTKTKLLEVNHPMMDHPTTGEIVGDEFFYVANAQFESFNKDGTLFPMEKLYQPVVLKLKL